MSGKAADWVCGSATGARPPGVISRAGHGVAKAEAGAGSQARLLAACQPMVCCFVTPLTRTQDD